MPCNAYITRPNRKKCFQTAQIDINTDNSTIIQESLADPINECNQRMLNGKTATGTGPDRKVKFVWLQSDNKFYATFLNNTGMDNMVLLIPF